MIPKFRAWIKTEKRMIETDDLLDIDYENEVVMTQRVYFENGLPDDRDLDNFVFDEIKLMQSTGRKDTSENEIFAGDILKVTDKNEGKDSWFEVVSYNEEKAMFVTDEVNKNSNIPATPLYSLFDTDLFIVEIVGNIYENSELVGDKQ